MNMQIITDSFDFHVDAQYYGYQWTEDMYITVEFTAIKKDDGVVSSVHNIKGTPWLLGSIIARNNWMEVDKEITAATQVHAVKEFKKQGMLAGIHPTIASAIAPHINY